MALLPGSGRSSRSCPPHLFDEWTNLSFQIRTETRVQTELHNGLVALEVLLMGVLNSAGHIHVPGETTSDSSDRLRPPRHRIVDPVIQDVFGTGIAHMSAIAARPEV